MDSSRMRLRGGFSGALRILCIAFFIFAGSVASAMHMVSFGDSLTHNDILWLVYGNSRDLYGDDPAEAAFRKADSGDDTRSSYAVAGSESSDTKYQIAVYELLRLIGEEEDPTVVHYEIGGNDILNNVEQLAAFPVGADAVADAVIDTLVDNIRADLSGLRASHPAARLIIWTIPDITVTPEHCCDLSDTEAGNIKQHTERVNAFVKGLARYSGIAVVDIFTLSRQVVEEPPIIFGHQLLPPPVYGDFNNLFADEIHPTAVSNALIANAISLILRQEWGISIPLYTQEELADLAHISH